MQELNKSISYRFGWKLLLIQNIILLFAFVLCFPWISNELFMVMGSLNLIYYFSRGLNYLFTFALILDLIAIFIISKSTFTYFFSQKKESFQINYRNKEFWIPISGFLWIIFSLVWRFPFYLIGGFDLGYRKGFRIWELEDNQFYYNQLNNPFMVLFQVLGGISLLFFLFYQEKYFYEIIDPEELQNDVGNIGIGRLTLLGILNLIGMIFLFLGSNFTLRSIESMEQFGTRPNGVFLILGIFLKIFFIPILMLWSSIRILSFVNFSLLKDEAPLPRAIIEHSSKTIE